MSDEVLRGGVHHRRKADVASLVALATVIIQLSGGVWYVAKMDAVVGQLTNAVSEIRQSTRDGDNRLRDQDMRIRVLEHQRAEDDRRTEQMEARLREKGAL